MSPAERDYLVKQGNTIMAYGGTGEDVRNFGLAFLGLPREDRTGRVTGNISETGGPGPMEPNKILGISTKAYQGLTFGFGDEFVGTLMGIMPGGRTPQEGRDLYREILAAGSGSKVVDIIAELAGGAVTGATAARAAGLGASGLAQAGAAGAGGAVYAGADAEGGITDRAKAAAVGAVAGTVLGAGIGAVAAVAGPIVKPATRGILDQLGKLGRSVQHRLPGIGTSEDHARRVLLATIDAETPSVPGRSSIDFIRERVRSLRDAGVSPTIADAAGEETLGLLSQTLSSRTPVKQQLAEAIFERQAAQGQRLSGRMLETVFQSDKFGLQNAYQAVDDIASTMRKIAKPLYEEAHRATVPVTPRMKALLGNPRLRAAYEEGLRIAQSEDLSKAGQAALEAGRREVPALPSGSLLKAAEEKLLELNVSPERMREVLAQMPDDFPAELPVRALDYMQQGISKVKDRLLSQAQGAQRRGTSSGTLMKEFNALNEQVEEILEEATRAAPVFGKARSAWAGFSAARDAVENGRGFSGKAPETVAREIEALSSKGSGLADFYRLGAMQDIVEKIRGPISKRETADVAREVFGGRIFKSPDDADMRRIRALFNSDEAAENFVRRVTAEARLSRTAEAVGSSRAGRGGRSVEDMENAMEGPTPPIDRMTAWLVAVGTARQRMMRGTKNFQSRVADDVAAFMSRGLDGPEALDTFLDSLEDFQRREALQKAFGANVKLGLSTTLGGGIGRLFSN